MLAKKGETIGQVLLEKWISVFGRMKTLHSDRGGKLVNSEISRLAEYLDDKISNTTAYSTNQKGSNVVNRMMERMLFMEPYLKPEIALAWSLCAKNTLDNVNGVSPYQLVFGETPSLPAIYCSGPPGLEEVKVNKGMSEHIQAMHMAREAFIQCENDNALKIARKKRCFTNAQQIEAEDWFFQE